MTATFRQPILWAIAAAMLFGITTPLAKVLSLPPFAAAGLLYLGAGAGLFAIRFMRDRGWHATGLARTDSRHLAARQLLAAGVDPSSKREELRGTFRLRRS